MLKKDFSFTVLELRYCMDQLFLDYCMWHGILTYIDTHMSSLGPPERVEVGIVNVQETLYILYSQAASNGVSELEVLHRVFFYQWNSQENFQALSLFIQ
jgi:hypothetical protein